MFRYAFRWIFSFGLRALTTNRIQLQNPDLTLTKYLAINTYNIISFETYIKCRQIIDLLCVRIIPKFENKRNCVKKKEEGEEEESFEKVLKKESL